MGDQLASYFEKAKQKGGITMQVKLAMLVKMSQAQAKAAPDTPETLTLFDEAMGKL